MKIGIFLGYGPQVTLNKEGLGRYLGGLLQGFLLEGQDITIACPHWSLKTVLALAKDFSIDTETIHWLTNKTDPPAWRIYQLLNRPRHKLGLRAKLYAALNTAKEKAVRRFAGAKSGWGLLYWCFIYFAVGIAAFAGLMLAAAPLALIVFVKKAVQALKSKIKIDSLTLMMFKSMNDAVINELIKRINRAKPFDVWFVPSLFWPQVNAISNGVVVINAPDLIPEEFAYGFADVLHSGSSVSDCRKTIEQGKYFITYSEYIRSSSLVDRFGKPERHSIAIGNVNYAMDRYLYITPQLASQNGCSGDPERAYAYRLMNGSPECRYLFYSSQARYSKNLLSLIKAYEYLLRNDFIHQKLYLTADYMAVEELRTYVTSHRLESSIISYYNVPVKTLAALYACADLVVNPTLYEGGFPFTFGEGMSVGTPSVMSDIPQVRGILEPAGLEEIMFDPYDWLAMAKKIKWGLDNREELYQKELPLYQKLSKRTSAVVAQEYLKAFEGFMKAEHSI